MAIKVSKPSINIREKLSELDFDKVPFQKMPAGSVLQVVHTEHNTFDSSSSSYQSVVSLSISPKSINSKILIEWSGLIYNYNGASSYSYSRQISRSDLVNEIFQESYAWGWGEGVAEKIIVSDWRMMDETAHGLNTLTYTVSLNPNGQRAYLYGTPRNLFTITEIAQ
jgi:hypothetical protein